MASLGLNTEEAQDNSMQLLPRADVACWYFVYIPVGQELLSSMKTSRTSQEYTLSRKLHACKQNVQAEMRADDLNGDVYSTSLNNSANFIILICGKNTKCMR